MNTSRLDDAEAHLKTMFPEGWVTNPVNLIEGSYENEMSNRDSQLNQITNLVFPYLDNGFVQLVDWMGSDRTIAKGARTSFNNDAYKSDAKNRGLINYLIKNEHMSPVELPTMMFQIRVPLFIRAQHVRHRMQSCNWESQRYSKQEFEYYTPPKDRVRDQDDFNKQGSGEFIGADIAEDFQVRYKATCERSMAAYEDFIDKDISRETARGVLPPTYFTTGVFSMKLRNMFHYLGLRNDSHAQPEIQLLAFIIEHIVARAFPMAYDAWADKVGGVEFTADEVERIKSLVGYEDYEQFSNKMDDDMSERKKRDLFERYKELETGS